MEKIHSNGQISNIHEYVLVDQDIVKVLSEPIIVRRGYFNFQGSSVDHYF